MKLPDGSFSITNWSGYPAGLPKPTGPFRLLKDFEYAAARRAADRANRAMRRADSRLQGLHIHEVQPVKFGGSPIDPLNKILLTPAEHRAVTAWWYQLQRDLSK
jgi:filamentous hemagglutinin